MRPTLTIVALIAASPALAARCPLGQLYRVRLDECVSLSSPLARPSLDPECRQKINMPPEAGPPVAAPPLTDPPPDKVDEAAWRMIPLLRAAAERWAAMVSPPRVETPPPDPWPSLSVSGLGNKHKDFLSRPP